MPCLSCAVAPRPYSEDRLQKNFAEVRELAFGNGSADSSPTCADQGAVEGDADGGSITD